MNSTISHFQIKRLLGRGGRGEVYEAFDTRLQRVVALKILSSQDGNDSESRHALIAEARRAAGLNHPHIATLYELGEENGQVFFAMEFVEGETLEEKIRAGPLTLATILDLAIQTAEGLKAAHARGLIHCDLKPRNVMVDRDQRVKILDFGFCRDISLSSTKSPGAEAHRSSSEEPVAPESESFDAPPRSGTLHYLSPEQARGEALDARTDMFSFGVMLCEMLTGHRPFERKDAASTLRALHHDAPPPLSSFRGDAPLELENVVRKLLEKDRVDRYFSAESLLKDLARIRRLASPRAERNEITSPPSTDLVESIPSSANISAARRPAILQRRRRVLWLVAGVAAAMIPLDYLLAPPNRMAIARILAYAVIAALSSAAFFVLKRKSRSQAVYFPTATAFRGLLPFLEADRDHFYGRESDQLALFGLIGRREFRFGVLFGESGCGKTSLLRAGLIPRLWEEGYLPIYCRAYKDPLSAVVEECRRRTSRDRMAGESPLEFLRRLTREEDVDLVLLFDQFEEFFSHLKTRSQREPFLSFVSAACNDPDLRIRFLFSLRSDFIYLINAEFAGHISDPLRSSRLHHLRNFDEKQAAEIMERSIRRAGLPCEAGFSRAIAHDLAVAGWVLPSELQIVGERIQNKRLYTMKAYRLSGGKEPLVYSFLEDVIQVSEDPESAGLLLRSLISDENSRLSLPLDEIAKRVQRSRHSVERILNTFVESRLIREIQDEDPWRYELMHEYLIEKINQITGRVLDATQRANRLFRQYLSNFLVDDRTRIPLAKLWFVRRHCDLPRGAREEKLLRKSWRRGLWVASVVVVSLMILVLGAAGAMSVDEQWTDLRLRDGHTAAVRRVEFSPDGRLLISCGEDGKVMVWDFARRQRLATLNDHQGWVTALAISPDGRWIAAGGADQTVVIWEAAHFQKQAVLSDHSGAITSLAFSHDGRTLASVAKQTILWRVGSWTKLKELPVTTSYGSIAFSGNDEQLISQSGLVWDIGTDHALAEASQPGYNWAAVSADQTKLVGVDSDGTVSFWKLNRPGSFLPRELLSSRRVHRDHGRAATFSPDGRYAATGAEDVVLWDAVTRTRLVRFEHSAIVWSVAFSPDGRWLVSAHGDGAILVWSVEERERVANLNEHGGAVRNVAFSNNGRWVASASEDQSIILWDLQRGEKAAVLNGHTTRVTAVAFGPDDSWLASCDQDGVIIFWDLKQRAPRLKFKHHFPGTHVSPSYCLTISPDGRWVAATQGVYRSADGSTQVDLTELARPVNWGHIYGEAFSSDGRLLVAVMDNGKIALWDTRAWNEIEAYPLQGTQLISVAFSPDGTRFVTGEDGGAVRLWNTRPIRLIGILGEHMARIKAVAFSPDGREVASAGDDQKIALWDVRARRMKSFIGTHNAPVLTVAFSPDGKRLVAGSHDTSVHVYTRHRVLWGYRLD